MNPRRSWLVYSVIRIGIFAVVLVLLMLLQVPWYFSAIAAALIAFALSLIFLRRPREEAAASLYEARNARKRNLSSAPISGEDEDVEDAELDRAANDEGSERDR